jgi:hypothetical protein
MSLSPAWYRTMALVVAVAVFVAGLSSVLQFEGAFLVKRVAGSIAVVSAIALTWMQRHDLSGAFSQLTSPVVVFIVLSGIGAGLLLASGLDIGGS